jgi:hydrogenase expression/formation protein HypD
MSIDGFICPGHVAVITGSDIFRFLPEKYGLGCVVSGFEPTDLLQSVLMLITQINAGSPDVGVQYSRAVTENGNIIAQEQMRSVFKPCDADWRGFGNIPLSGLALRKEYEDFDAGIRIPLNIEQHHDNPACICGDILRGLKQPDGCRLFRNPCTTENPIGACMVSSEGTCNSWFKYHR